VNDGESLVSKCERKLAKLNIYRDPHFVTPEQAAHEIADDIDVLARLVRVLVRAITSKPEEM